MPDKCLENTRILVVPFLAPQSNWVSEVVDECLSSVASQGSVFP